MKTKQRAFSLIEILATLVIIAIVSAIGISHIKSLRQKAGDRAVLARLKQLDIARHQFIQEWGRLEAERMWANPDDDPNSATDTDAQNRYALLKRYIERPQNQLTEVAPPGYRVNMPTTLYETFTGTRIEDGQSFSDEANF